MVICHDNPLSPFVPYGGRWGDVLLKDLSPEDSDWDYLKLQNNKVSQLYLGTAYEFYAHRINSCANVLEFVEEIDLETGVVRYRLKSAHFCRVPRCPTCQIRKMLSWRAKTFQAMPQIIRDNPKARFIHLVLTIRNPHITELRHTLDVMSKAWKRLTQLKSFPAIGWLRATEVTRQHDCIHEAKHKSKKLKLPCPDCVPTEYAHPHFHCLLMVEPSYFTGRKYLSHDKWVEMWRKSLRVDYDPQVSVRAIPDNLSTQEFNSELLEIVKYAVKVKDDVLTGKQAFYSDSDWLVEMTKQLYNSRIFNVGGTLRDCLKDLENEPEDLVNTDIAESEDNELEKRKQVVFAWCNNIRHYREFQTF